MKDDLRTEIQRALNRHCAENESDTPDWILAEYLKASLAAFDLGVNMRDRWYQRGRYSVSLQESGPTPDQNPGTGKPAEKESEGQ